MAQGRIARILQILTALQSGQGNRVDNLVEMFGLSWRTIFRDLKELREIGLQYRYDPNAGAYSTNPAVFLPPINLNRKEAMALLLLAHKASSLIRMPYKKAALLAAMKLENNLPGTIRQYCYDSLQNMSIGAKPELQPWWSDNTFAQLQEAILRRRLVGIEYCSDFRSGKVSTNLTPYHLMYSGHAWHVIGNSSFHKRIWALKLNQIKHLKVLDKCFIEPDKFDVNEYLGRAWSMRLEGRLYNIRLRFMPEVADDVADVQWHSTQTVTFEDDGSAILEFRVDGLNEIKWWILSYGDRVQVLAPEVLRQKIIEIAQKMVTANRRKRPSTDTVPSAQRLQRWP